MVLCARCANGVGLHGRRGGIIGFAHKFKLIIDNLLKCNNFSGFWAFQGGFGTSEPTSEACSIRTVVTFVSFQGPKIFLTSRGLVWDIKSVGF